MKERHPYTTDHTPARLRDIAQQCECLSHGAKIDFDVLQDACNLLNDWADLRDGVKLVDISGYDYPLPIGVDGEMFYPDENPTPEK